MPAIPIDAIANVRWPTSLVEWTGLLAGLFAPPASSWGFQDASGNVTDQVGSNPLTATGSQTYAQPAIGWSRGCVRQTASSTLTGTGANISTTSELLVALLRCDAAPAGTSALVTLGAGGDPNEVALLATGLLQADNKGHTANGSIAIAGASILLAVKLDRSISQMVVYNDLSEIIKPAWASPSSSTAMSFGDGSTWPASVGVLAGALWTGSAAEQPDATIQSLISLIKAGHP
jgi:hypothetical protein